MLYFAAGGGGGVFSSGNAGDEWQPRVATISATATDLHAVGAVSVIGPPLPFTLECATLLLALESLLLRGPGRLRGLASFRNDQRLRHHLREPCDRGLAILQLTPLTLRHDPESSLAIESMCELVQQPCPFVFPERRRVAHVPHQLD